MCKPARAQIGRALVLAALTGTSSLSSACAGVARDYGEVTVREGAAGRSLKPLEMAQVGVAAVGVVETDVGRGLAFVIDPDGYLLTNRHVVEDADFIDHIKFPALEPPRAFKSVQVIYIDPERDLALLKVATRRPLPSLPLAVPRRGAGLAVSDHVLLLAAKGEGPGGADGRELDSGFVAHLGRVRDLEVFNESVGPGPFFGFTTGVQRGQSGGPVIDEHGRAVGVVTWTWKHRVGGYAVPIGSAVEMLAARPKLDTSAQQLARADQRVKRFVGLLNRRESEHARRMLSPTHARSVRQDTLRVMGEFIADTGQDAVRTFVAALESLVGENAPEIEDDEQRFAAALELVMRTGSETFRESLGVGDLLPGDQVVSFFWEFAHAYLSARHFGHLPVDESVEAALRRLQTLDAARTFAFADFARKLADERVEVAHVELIPGAYAPRAVVSLSAGGAARSPAAKGAMASALERIAPNGGAVAASDGGEEHVLQMRMEWGDWYIAEIQTRSRG